MRRLAEDGGPEGATGLRLAGRLGGLGWPAGWTAGLLSVLAAGCCSAGLGVAGCCWAQAAASGATAPAAISVARPLRTRRREVGCFSTLARISSGRSPFIGG